MSRSRLAHLAIFAANFIYAANFTIAKEVMPRYIQPMGFIVLRVSGAMLLYWLVAGIFAPKENIEKKDWGILMLCGLFGVGFNQSLFFLGLNITTPINAAIMMITTPILVLIISMLLAKESISGLKVTGITLGFTGALVLLLMKGGASFNSGTALGDLYVLINAAAFAIYLVISKPLMLKYHFLTVIKWTFTFGLICVIPFGWNELQEVQWHTMPADIVWATVFVVVATTFLTYLFNIFGLKQLNASAVSSYIYLQPLLATLIALAYGKDALNGTKILSALLIFCGVYLVSRPSKKLNPNDP